MTKSQIQEQILSIINSSSDSITADLIYIELRRSVDPGRTQETIRKYIRELVNHQDHLIGSNNSGYFKIDSSSKAEDAIQYLLNRIPDLQERANNLKKIWNQNNPEDQII